MRKALIYRLVGIIGVLGVVNNAGCGHYNARQQIMERLNLDEKDMNRLKKIDEWRLRNYAEDVRQEKKYQHMPTERRKYAIQSARKEHLKDLPTRGQR
jgi:mannose/fructose/N-acetylgalactosamine-specific phosphotransferase system component IIB